VTQLPVPGGRRQTTARGHTKGRHREVSVIVLFCSGEPFEKEFLRCLRYVFLRRALKALFTIITTQPSFFYSLISYPTDDARRKTNTAIK
jgi:hypothetical protein